MSVFLNLLRLHVLVEPRRLTRAQEEFKAEQVVTMVRPGEVVAVVKGRYRVTIATHPTVTVDCDCPDWRERGKTLRQACKHQIAVALLTEPPPAPSQTPPPVQVAPPVGGLSAFGQQVAGVVAQAVSRLAAEVQACLAAGSVPFLLGPTGCAKTSSVRTVATSQGWGFEEVAGADSFADADLVGVRLAGGFELPGLFARAFRRARAGETVLLFLDEFTRFNVRAQDLLMRPLLPTPPDVARAMGLATQEPLALVEAPLWGVEHAPSARVQLVLAANPWGAPLDPALVRRVEPIFVGFDEAVAALFTDALRAAITLSWQATARGELPLPIEYGALVRAESPDDARVVKRYVHRLQALDPVAAEGFLTLVAGQA